MTKLDKKIRDAIFKEAYTDVWDFIPVIKKVIREEILKALPTHNPRTLTRNEVKSVIKNILD